MNRYAITILLIVAAALAVVFLAGNPPAGKYGASVLDPFARCLAERQLTMYGAYWCSHCKNEKAAFGDSFRYVPYVECTQEPDRCVAAGVEGYPTWVLADGRRLVGEQGLEGLSRASGCTLPGKDINSTP